MVIVLHVGQSLYKSDFPTYSFGKLGFFLFVFWFLGHLHLKVRSALMAAFRISLAISPHFASISSKNFSFLIFQCFT